MNLGRVLSKMRKRAGLNQEEFALQMNMTQANISRLENNKREIKARDLLDWANKTDAQDMLIALTLNIDLSMLADVDAPILIEGFTDLLTNVVPSFINLLGVII